MKRNRAAAQEDSNSESDRSAEEALSAFQKRLTKVHSPIYSYYQVPIPVSEKGHEGLHFKCKR